MLRIPAIQFAHRPLRFGNISSHNSQRQPATAPLILENLAIILQIAGIARPVESVLPLWIADHQEPDRSQLQEAYALVEKAKADLLTLKPYKQDNKEPLVAEQDLRKAIYRLAYLPGNVCKETPFSFDDLIGQTGSDGKVLWNVIPPHHYNDQLTLLRDLRALGILQYNAPVANLPEETPQPPNRNKYVLTPQMRLILEILEKMEPLTPQPA